MPLPTTALHTSEAAAFAAFSSRRSVVHSTKGIVSCTQPLAAKCGLQVLQAGGECSAAGLNVTEPCSTGIGGDMFLLYYDAKTRKVRAMNGSGRAGNKCTLQAIRQDLGLAEGTDGQIPLSSVHGVTVPGAAAGWCDTVKRFGSGNLTMGQILDPAIELGEQGFPVSAVASRSWHNQETLLRDASPNFSEMLKKDPQAKDGVRPPRNGEIMYNPTLAATFRELAAKGKDGFYRGRIAEEIVKTCQALGGHLELEDLAHHLEMGSEDVEPISLKVAGTAGEDVEIWEHPPNGQGIVALMALGIIQELQKAGSTPRWGPSDHNTAPYLHAIIEALRISFTDARWFVTDPNVVKVPTAELISSQYLADRAALFSSTKALSTIEPGKPSFTSPAFNSCDTVYLAVTDSEGNAASFINSNYEGFGTGIIPKGCGFTLQNRGANFSLNSEHPNVLEPRKRPYHTIIPSMVTNPADNSLHSVFGVMGGFMQPQGHVQVLLNQLIGGLDPQQALDSPRICIDFDWKVSIEEGMPEETVEGLRKLGHQVEVVKGWDRSLFGRGQVIRLHVDPVEKKPVWSAGSDMRGDGGAYPAF